MGNWLGNFARGVRVRRSCCDLIRVLFGATQFRYNVWIWRTFALRRGYRNWWNLARGVRVRQTLCFSCDLIRVLFGATQFRYNVWILSASAIVIRNVFVVGNIVLYNNHFFLYSVNISRHNILLLCVFLLWCPNISFQCPFLRSFLATIAQNMGHFTGFLYSSCVVHVKWLALYSIHSLTLYHDLGTFNRDTFLHTSQIKYAYFTNK